jgi:hypothetical protein
MNADLPRLREDPFTVFIVSLEDPAEPGVTAGDVVELAGLVCRAEDSSVFS